MEFTREQREAANANNRRRDAKWKQQDDAIRRKRKEAYDAYSRRFQTKQFGGDEGNNMGGHYD